MPEGPAQSLTNSFTATSGVQKDVETSIWVVDTFNNITPRWVNTNGGT